MCRLGVAYQGDIKLRAGEESNHYINIKKAVTCSDTALVLINELCNIIEEIINKHRLKWNDVVIAAAGVGGHAIVGGLMAFGLGLRGLLIRDSVKDHGLGNLIEGPDPSDRDFIILIDDVISTGSSILKSCESLYSVHKRYPDCVAVVVDRRENPGEKIVIGGNRIPVKYLYTLNDFLSDELEEFEK